MRGREKSGRCFIITSRRANMQAIKTFLSEVIAWKKRGKGVGAISLFLPSSLSPEQGNGRGFSLLLLPFYAPARRWMKKRNFHPSPQGYCPRRKAFLDVISLTQEKRGLAATTLSRPPVGNELVTPRRSIKNGEGGKKRNLGSLVICSRPVMSAAMPHI